MVDGGAFGMWLLFFVSSYFINALIKNWHNHCRLSHWSMFTPSFIQSPAHFGPAPTLAFAVPLSFFSLFLCSFCSFLEVIVLSYRPCLASVCLGSFFFEIISHAKASGLATTKVGSESKYKDNIWCGLTYFGFFSEFSVLGIVAFPGWRMSMTICFHWSSLLVMNFLIQG